MEVESVSPSISRSSSRTSPCSTNISESGDSRVGSSIHHTPTQEKAKYITCLLEGLSPGNTGAEIVNLIRSAWALLCPIYFDTEHAAFCYSDDTCNGASVPISVGIDKTLKKKDFIVEIGKRIDGAISARHRTDVAGGTDKSRNVLRIHVAERHDGTEWEAYDISADVFLEEPYTMAYTFNHEVFCKAQVKRIHRQLAHLLSQLCEGNDGAEIGSIQLLNAHDQLEIDSWNRHPPIRKQETFPEALQRQTDLRPEAVAIDGWDGRYTYHELNIVTDKLAEHLLSVAADSTDVGLIPICFEKSVFAIIAMIAVQKAGCGYVVLDPTHPPARLRAIIATTAATVILASPQQSEKVSALASNIVVLDRESLRNLRPKSTHLPKITPRTTAYVQFTSGSTGEPKGAIIDQGALCSTLSAHAYWNLGPETRFFQFASYVFAACVVEIFCNMYYGGCVCVPRGDNLKDNLAGAIREWKATATLMTPTGAAFLLHPDQVPNLQAMFLGGEPVTKAVSGRWANRVELFVGYGASEATFGVTGRRILPESDEVPQDVGRNINSRCWIVDPEDHNRLVPIGGVGELLVEAGGLSSGYLNDPERTALSFTSSPVFLANGHEGQHPLLKTGDLVRYSATGSLIYVGRKDTQAKRNGIRIDLSEVAHCLKTKLGDPWIVVADMISPLQLLGRRFLATFLTSGEVTKSSSGEHEYLSNMSSEFRLRLELAKADLEALVPYYMVPQLYIPMTHIPTNLSGKIDRKALRSLGASFSPSRIALYGLGTARSARDLSHFERLLQSAWAEVLKMPTKTIGDGHFFQLGGDSVAAMRLSQNLRRQGWDLSVADCFRNPQLGAMAAVMKQLSDSTLQVEPNPEPYALLLSTSQEDKSSLNAYLSRSYTIDEKSIEDVYPCSPMQESLMALGTRDPKTYVCQSVFSLPHEVDMERIRAAWDLVYRETSILRATLVDTPDFGTLVVVLAHDLSWKSASDLSGHLRADKEDYMSYGDRLSRIAVLESGPERYLVWTWHHAILDGWSLDQVLRRVDKAYDVLTLPSEAPYSRFSRYLLQCDKAAAREFWKSELVGAVPARLPLSRRLGRDYHARTKSIFEVESTVQPASMGHYTLPIMLQGAWALLMSKYSGGQDIVFGVVSSGRHAPVSGVEQIIGPTIATLPFRAQVDSDAEVSQFLGQVQDKNSSLMEHEHLGLQNIAKLGTDFATICQFNNLLVIQPAYFDFDGRGLMKMVANMQHMSYDYPLVMECFLCKEGKVVFRAHYDEMVLSTTFAEGIVHSMSHLMAQLGSGRQRKVGDLEMLSPYDESRLAAWMNVGATAQKVQECVHVAIGNRQSQSPSAPAICAWDGDFNYRELETWSNLFARYMLSMGLNTGTYVPVCMEKSKWAVVVFLGLMKCGVAYVALDPGHPVQRLETIVKDLKSTVIVASKQQRGRVKTLAPSVIVFDTKVLQQRFPTEQPRLPDVSPSSAVVVQFTSGSTGRPKGIVIQHDSLCSSAAAHGSFYNIGPATRMYNFAAFVFDVSVADMWTTLMRGGCVCVPKDEDRHNNLSRSMRDLSANTAFLTPSVAALLEPSQTPLEKLILGGERVTSELVDKWAHALHLVACYGPAETCIYSSATHALTKHSNPANIGKPFGCCYWIVDVHSGRLAPIGCVGELWIEGPILAREYLNDPTRTASSFVINPSWAQGARSNSTRRFYRTGDLVRYADDGSVVFVARKDTQVKIRGQRVELDEVQHAFSTSKAVKSATVIVPESGPFADKLVAVLTLTGERVSQGGRLLQLLSSSTQGNLPQTISDIRKHLASTLAPYMVPSVLAVIGVLPRNSSGKVDKTEVQNWLQNMDDDTRQEIISQSVLMSGNASLSDKEKKLRRLCAQVLRIPEEQIPMDHNFISIGGDSISAIRLVMLGRTEGLEIKAKDILTSESLAILSNRAAGLLGVAEDVSETGITSVSDQNSFSRNTSGPTIPELYNRVLPQFGVTPEEIEDIYPCSPVQEGMLMTRSISHHPFYEASSLVEVKGPPGAGQVDPDRLQRAWRQVVNHHPLLRTVFFESLSNTHLYDQAVLKTAPENTIRIECADEEAVSFLQSTEANQRSGHNLNSTHRATICRTPSGRIFFKIELLHTCYDGHSTMVLLRDLSAAYGNRLCSETGSQYSRYVEFLRQAPVENELHFWKRYLEGIRPCNLAHAPCSSKTSGSLKTVPIIIPNARALMDRAKDQGLTVASMIKTAWSLVLSRYTHSDDVCFGFVASGRDTPIDGIGDAVGPFIKQLICRSKLNKSSTLSTVLRSIQEESFDCMTHQNAPLLHIQGGLTRRQGRLFNTNMSLVQVPSDGLKFPDLEYEYVSLSDPAEFDVTIRIEVYEDGLDMLLSYWDGPVPDRMASEISLVATDTLQLLSNARNADIRVTDVVSKLSTQSYERGLLPITTVMTMPTGRDLYKSDGNPGPSTPIEVSAVDIGVMKLFVAGVLSLRPEDVHEDADFFTIGGDSLSGMQLILQAREKGIYITMTDVAEAKSVSDLARSANRGWKQRRLNPWWAGTS